MLPTARDAHHAFPFPFPFLFPSLVPKEPPRSAYRRPFLYLFGFLKAPFFRLYQVYDLSNRYSPAGPSYTSVHHPHFRRRLFTLWAALYEPRSVPKLAHSSPRLLSDLVPILDTHYANMDATDNFLSEYLADMDCSALPHIMQDDPDNGPMVDLDAHGEHQLANLASGKSLFDDGDLSNTVAPSWLSGPQFEPTNNPESSGSPSPDFSGSMDEDLAPTNQTDESDDFSHLLFPTLPHGNSIKTEPPPTGVGVPKPIEDTTPAVHFKEEEIDNLPLSAAASKAEKPAPKKKRKRSGAGHGDKVRRQKFLERNRVAASKCRRKKKEAELALEAEQRKLEEEHLALKASRSALVDEILELRKMIMAHAGCGNQQTDHWMSTETNSLERILGKETTEDELRRSRESKPAVVEQHKEQPSLQPEALVLAPPVQPTLAHPMQQQPPPPPPPMADPLNCTNLMAVGMFPTSSQELVAAAYSTPPLMPGEIPMIPQGKHVRNASLASSFASMTSYASSNFAPSDMESGRKSSSGSSSYNMSPISPLYAEFPDSLSADMLKHDGTLEGLSDSLFDSM